MKTENNYYVCSSIPYANAKPHIGTALEFVISDVLARWHRKLGKEVFFLTGTDEHGQKLHEAANLAGVSEMEYLEGTVGAFLELLPKLGISNDGFIRTTSEKHKEFARDFWNRLMEAGDLEKAKYKGLYCVGCEKFVLEKDLVDGKCVDHKREPLVVEEENYFFKLSKYNEKIKELIESDTVKIRPVSKKNEILSVIKEGLQDVSFSRPKSSLKWGIEVPDDPEHVMYVWCDALTNYMSGVDREKFWPNDVNVIGKDILRFHAAIWIGMLISAGYELPKAILVHGHIGVDGQKMSKSLNNVVDPMDYLNEFGEDAVRYYLLKEIPTLDDGDFSRERFISVYNEELANVFGNLVSRVLAMNKKYFGGEIQVAKLNDGWKEKVEEVERKMVEKVGEFDLKKAMEALFEFAQAGNKYVEDMKPWVLAKEGNLERLKEVMGNLVEVVRLVGELSEPFLPNFAGRVFSGEVLFPKKVEG